MLRSGACGYVTKSVAHEELVRAVRAAHLERTYLSPEIAGGVVERSTRQLPRGDGSAETILGSREREVLRLLAEGKTSREMAQEMQISLKTVEAHRRHITEKLGLHGTAELTKYAVREGLTSLETADPASLAP
jgi:DNA-binding NarL/FixJ family response regulator